MECDKMTGVALGRFNTFDLLHQRGHTMPTPIISSSQDVMGGTPVFVGTRVPIQTLIDYLEAGESIDDFLEGFPTVKRVQAVAFLNDAKEKMLAEVTADEDPS
jgi:uncharacterized protein (DUF433 family)